MVINTINCCIIAKISQKKSDERKGDYQKKLGKKKGEKESEGEFLKKRQERKSVEGERKMKSEI